jgi:hypothetical protein
MAVRVLERKITDRKELQEVLDLLIFEANVNLIAGKTLALELWVNYAQNEKTLERESQIAQRLHRTNGGVNP